MCFALRFTWVATHSFSCLIVMSGWNISHSSSIKQTNKNNNKKKLSDGHVRLIQNPFESSNKRTNRAKINCIRLCTAGTTIVEFINLYKSLQTNQYEHIICHLEHPFKSSKRTKRAKPNEDIICYLEHSFKSSNKQTNKQTKQNQMKT